jgi:hypothetical protein
VSAGLVGRPVALLFAIAACAPSVRPLTEVAVPPPAMNVAPPATVAGSATSPPPPGCMRRVRVVSLVAQTPTCQINGLRVGSSALLSLPCTGVGDADADFGPGQVFHGTSDGTNVTLTSARVVDFEDACRWRFTQQITGAPGSHKLQLAYDEEIVDGDECYSPCGARGEISVE